MLKKILFISTLSILSIITYGQDVKKDAETIKTKMDVFASQNSLILKLLMTTPKHELEKYQMEVHLPFFIKLRK